MRAFTTLLILPLLVALGHSRGVSYDGNSVLRVQYNHEVEPMLRQMVQEEGLDIWSDKKGVMDIMTNQEQRRSILKLFSHSNDARAAVMIQDVQMLIDDQVRNSGNSQSSKVSGIDNTKYRTFEQLQAEMDGLEADFPDMVSSYITNTTHQNRPIRVMKVSTGGSDRRPVVWIDCGIHAREWISHASCMYFLDQLTSKYGEDDTITEVLDTYDFHIMPVTNPDGYAYTWSDDRMWRKNRVPYGACYGTDCNRNFDSNFGGAGSSDVACADTYHGPSAFCEAESSAVRSGVSGLHARLTGYYSLHSYSQYWMTPYGYTKDLPADFDEMMRVSKIGVEALEAVHGTQYTYGNIADIIYVASGGSIDWVYDELGTVYSFAMELRDQGQYGFLLPEKQIIPTGEETLAGILASVQAYKR